MPTDETRQATAACPGASEHASFQSRIRLVPHPGPVPPSHRPDLLSRACKAGRCSWCISHLHGTRHTRDRVQSTRLTRGKRVHETHVLPCAIATRHCPLPLRKSHHGHHTNFCLYLIVYCPGLFFVPFPPHLHLYHRTHHVLHLLLSVAIFYKQLFRTFSTYHHQANPLSLPQGIITTDGGHYHLAQDIYSFRTLLVPDKPRWILPDIGPRCFPHVL